MKKLNFRLLATSAFLSSIAFSFGATFIVAIIVAIVAYAIPALAGTPTQMFNVHTGGPNLGSNQRVASGAAGDVRTGQTKLTYNPISNDRVNPVIALTIQNGTNAAISFNVIPKSVDADPALAEDVTVSGTYTWTEWLRLLKRDKFEITKMELQTDSVDGNFSKTLQVGTTRWDNISAPETIYLTKYRKPTGNGYADNLEINDRPIVVKGRTFLTAVSIAANSSLTFYFTVGGEESPTMTAVDA